MRISSCQNCKPGDQGFTLIEILVVLFIVTILAGLTVASLPGFVQSADVDTETRRLELLFDMARTEAMMDSSEFGFRRTDKGYEFLRFDDGSQSWKKAPSPFHERKLPEDLRMTLRADTEGFRLLGENLPPVLVLSSGETTPFRIILESRYDGSEYTFIADGYGQFRWDHEDNEERFNEAD